MWQRRASLESDGEQAELDNWDGDKKKNPGGVRPFNKFPFNISLLQRKVLLTEDSVRHDCYYILIFFQKYFSFKWMENVTKTDNFDAGVEH